MPLNRWRIVAWAGVLAMACWGAAAEAADRFYVYNNTTATELKGIYLAPAGTQKWGPNQTLNDKDHSLEVSERLPITGISRGRFDVKLEGENGRTCIKRGVDLSGDTTFDIRDSDLTDCR